jgi:hypothetical protein
MENNPYVGPRPYERGERHFYGREREACDLLSLILAQRVVLLDLSTAAAKHTWVKARVIPVLSWGPDPLGV